MPDALGRTLGTVIAYAIVAGAVFSAICLIMFSLFGSGHRRAAVQLLIEHARRPLFAIGICSALGDAAVNYDVAHQLGTNLAGLVSTVANMTAAALTAYFAIAFRRPVAHLIRNRSYEQRQGHKVATDAFDVLGSMWHLPMLMLAIASVVATIAAVGNGEKYCRFQSLPRCCWCWRFSCPRSRCVSRGRKTRGASGARRISRDFCALSARC